MLNPISLKIKNLKIIAKTNENNIADLNKKFFFGKNNIKKIGMNEKNIASFLIHIEFNNNIIIIIQ